MKKKQKMALLLWRYMGKLRKTDGMVRVPVDAYPTSGVNYLVAMEVAVVKVANLIL